MNLIMAEESKEQSTFRYEAEEDNGVIQMRCYLPNQQSYLMRDIALDSDTLVRQVKQDILYPLGFNHEAYHIAVVTTDMLKHMEDNRPITDYYEELQKGTIKFVSKN
ncbi:uncharacterized protein LOC106051702 isoform X1 [Biomphalaria glabrata]|uniref:Uncharacterized protein LOC106051702 isoform X1 n=1 Tax=Biomphalaria glabrata TaxID=6526 RepID=A0A9U8DVV9_BIOGL|nr:uncharacterized protein LOC106051702 isoform X1 [Biomphalaria glabrata]XP_013062360.2 uncharacterized protein LOC106051702 isoform X1 [Biomphalaria glabrata]XP_013062361.2 uncharacterized protein LOC106051702 isoform X1 [Biomphalaria glabrata]XP_055866498.1 uncharacterized protein LOC106051702 isoform X1 [Biomphalaria glabrata]